MYCKVKFYKKKYNGYSGKDYTYHTELPLKVLDKVLAPVSGSFEDQRALVVAVNVPESEIQSELIQKIKTIRGYDE